MAYKRYTRGVLIPYIALLLLTVAGAYTVVVAHWYLTSALIGILLVVIMVYLKKQLDTANTQMATILQQNRGHDFSARLSTRGVDSSLQLLYTEINAWQQYIQQLQQSAAAAKGFTDEILSHLPLGAFLLDEQMNLIFSNEKGRAFLNYRAAADHKYLYERAAHFFDHITELRSKGQMELKLTKDGEKQSWQLSMRTFQLEGMHYELVIAQNVQANLEKVQGRLSEDIMHVLTHEIMNSISPVHSLIDTLNLQLKEVREHDESVDISKETYDDILTSAQIIKKRSEGLMQFVVRYGMLAHLPALEMAPIALDPFLDDLKRLVARTLEEREIQFELQVLDKNMRMRADKKLLEQVIINLIKNAREAIEGDEGLIILRFSKGDGYNYISVCDNGPGIDPSIQERIFLPFYTTKARGSGIGLSLSRKIINAHNGRLFFKNHSGFTEFRIELPD